MKELEIDGAVAKGELLYPWDAKWRRRVESVRRMMQGRGRGR